jgi:RNA polymerase sigma-70 factor (ECF subfamily)
MAPRRQAGLRTFSGVAATNAVSGIDNGRAGMSIASQDIDLVQRIGRRDEAALRLLFARHHLPVFRFLVRMVRSDAIAEELANEVFLEVWRHASSYEGRSSVATWMLSIARNRAASLMRKRHEAPLDDARAAAEPDHADDPEVATQKADKAAAIRRCMVHLSAEHQEIVDLVYYHELSVAEVAEVVGIPEATVKTRMFYARKKLSELLREAGVDRGWP